MQLHAHLRSENNYLILCDYRNETDNKSSDRSTSESYGKRSLARSASRQSER